MRYRHVWPGLLLLVALGLLLLGLVRWGDHFLSPGPTGGIHRLLQLWAASRPADESAAASAAAPPPRAADSAASAPAALPPMTAPPATAAPSPPETPASESGAVTTAPTIPVPNVPAPPAPTTEVNTSTAERASEPAPSAPPVPAAPTPPPIRYALALGTFAVPDDAERVEAKLNQAGFSTVRFRQQASAKQFSVHVGPLKDPEEGPATVERLHKEGYDSTVLLIGRGGATVRVGEATPLRTAVQVAEKLRAAGYDARVVTDPTRAGEVSLRHGNFASRGEAEAASREIARLGVPNEVIQIR